MEDKKKDDIIKKYITESRAIHYEYDKKMEDIRKQRPINGRGSYPEERIFRKECDEKIKQLAEKYRNFLD